jgi:uncharacterized protein (DUF58 family)
VLTRHGWVSLSFGTLLVVTGIALHYPEIAAAGATLVVAVATAFAWVWNRVHLSVTRALDPVRATVGDTDARGNLVVVNDSTRSAARVIAREKLGTSHVDVQVPRLPPRARAEVSYDLPTDRRAILQVGPLSLVRSDPFGLVRFEQHYGTEQSFYIHPRRFPIARLPATLIRSLEGPTNDTAPRGSVAFHALREYAPGDDRRHIHWRSSARFDTLMVRQYVDTSLPDVTIVLDTRRSTHSDESFEQAIEVAASLIVLAAAGGFPIELVTTAAQSFDAQGASKPIQYFLDRLAGVELEGRGDLVQLVETRRGSGNALVVIASGLSDNEIRALAYTRNAYRSVIAAIVDPSGTHPLAQQRGIQVLYARSSSEFCSQWNAVRT